MKRLLHPKSSSVFWGFSGAALLRNHVVMRENEGLGTPSHHLISHLTSPHDVSSVDRARPKNGHDAAMFMNMLFLIYALFLNVQKISAKKELTICGRDGAFEPK
jgi:hypothetical protein